MIECIFTIDYEIYGNGRGSLKELAYEPTQKLSAIFDSRNARFVVFADVAELEMIEVKGADPAIELIIKQLKALYRRGFEIGLHIHPWWYGAQREDEKWILNYGTYNLCTQTKARIDEIIDRSIKYSRRLLGDPEFVPTSFRAGHLLFQPTRPLSDTLAERGIKVDSSVYKGGLWRQNNLDYRRAPKCAYYWKFTADVTIAESEGALLEVPIYTYMAPIWKLFTSKRVGLQQTSLTVNQTGKKIFGRLHDFLRFRYPLKFDLGQMTKSEMIQMINRIAGLDKECPSTYHPIVVIMHTKDPIDLNGVDSLLDYLKRSRIKISTLSDVYSKIKTSDRAPVGGL